MPLPLYLCRPGLTKILTGHPHLASPTQQWCPQSSLAVAPESCIQRSCRTPCIAGRIPSTRPCPQPSAIRPPSTLAISARQQWCPQPSLVGALESCIHLCYPATPTPTRSSDQPAPDPRTSNGRDLQHRRLWNQISSIGHAPHQRRRFALHQRPRSALAICTRQHQEASNMECREIHAV
jgi:hypothetical protein